MNEMVHTFGRIGIYSFGGPAAQIALMHRILVDEKNWLSETQFLNALSFAMLLPGPEAMQLATYAGWQRGGVPGGLLAGGLFVLPGAAVMLILSTVYAFFGQVPLIDAIFLGVQATVVAIVLEALFRVSRKALKRRSDWFIAALAFLAIFALHLPFPLIVALAAIWGYLRAAGTGAPPESAEPIAISQTLTTVLVWLAVWAAPIVLLALLDATLLTEIALFFSRLAVVTFGGAYAVLAYMAQTVVSDYGWITTPEMMDGLGLAETTPGPLILVTQFVGFLAGFREGGFGLALLAACITLWVTFTPCFLWIFAGAPYVERIIHMPRLSGALKAITAAVVGVILNLTIWFAAHVFFRNIGTAEAGILKVIWPEIASFDPVAGGIALVTGVLLLVFHAGIGWTLLAGALVGAFSLLWIT